METGRTDDQRRRWCERGRRENNNYKSYGKHENTKENTAKFRYSKDPLVFIFLNTDTCNSIQTHDSIYT